MTGVSSELEAEVDRALAAVSEGSTAGSQESELLDFKEDPTTRDARGGSMGGRTMDDLAAVMLADAAGCMANGEGGAIVIGVVDGASGQEAFRGTTLDRDWLRARIRELATPALIVDVTEANRGGARLLILGVPRNPGPEPHSIRVSRRGGRRTARRIGRQCQEMVSLAELTKWSAERQNYDWSTAASYRTLEDVRPAAIEVIRELLRASGEPDRVEIAGLEDRDLLARLQLLRPDGSLNRAGELLTCPSARSRLVYLHRAAAGQQSDVKAELAGRSLLEEFIRVLEAVELSNRWIQLPGADWPVRGVVEALPKSALREAIVNAMMHRDWGRTEPITVEHVGDELVVHSPGGFFGGVTADTILTTQSLTRNRLLGDVFRSLRIAEREGTGVDRMFVEMIQLGHHRPEFTERDGGIRVSIRGGDPIPEVLAVQAALPESLRANTRMAVAIDLLRRVPSCTRAELAVAAQEQESMLDSFLAEAESADVLVKTRNPRPDGEESWRLDDRIRDLLGPVLPYYSRSTPESIELVARLAAERGTIRNADVQDLLGVNSVRASQILAAAADERRIERGPGTARTGRGVYYVPT